MPEGHEESKEAYRDREELHIMSLAESLENGSLEDTLELAEEQRSNFGHDPTYFMFGAWSKLYYTAEIDRQRKGLEVIKWDAAQKPSHESGNNALYEFKYAGNSEDNREFTEEMYEVFLGYYMNLFEDPDYVAGEAFYKSFLSGVARIEEAGFKQLEATAFRSLTEPAVASAKARQAGEWQTSSEFNNPLDDVLRTQARMYRSEDPTRYEELMSLIESDEAKERVESANRGDDLAAAFLLGDFEAAELLLGDVEIIDSRAAWSVAMHKVDPKNNESRQWGHQFVEMMLQQHHFILDGDSFIELLLSYKDIAYLLVLTDHKDMLDVLFSSQDIIDLNQQTGRTNADVITDSLIIGGLVAYRMLDDESGRDEMLRRLDSKPDLDPKLREAITSWYDYPEALSPFAKPQE